MWKREARSGEGCWEEPGALRAERWAGWKKAARLAAGARKRPPPMASVANRRHPARCAEHLAASLERWPVGSGPRCGSAPVAAKVPPTEANPRSGFVGLGFVKKMA